MVYFIDTVNVYYTYMSLTDLELFHMHSGSNPIFPKEQELKQSKTGGIFTME